jgi:hypothetical protein
MRYILLVILVLISFGTSAQAPPMSIGGPQGINVKRILAQDWMSVPIMADTPVAPLTGSGWPGRGYVVFVAQNPDSICGGCPPADTSLWEYTGQRWKRVGMDYLTKLVFGGEVTQFNTFSRRFFVGSYGAFINGSYYTKVPLTTLTTSPKVADSTSRIDAIVLTPFGPTIKVGNAKQVPLKPSIASDEIELSTIYFPPFDTVARFIPVATGVTNVFRVPGKDSIFYSIDTATFAIKDSIGISVATNGLTASDKTIKLGGSLTENTNINLSSSRLNILSGSDTARFFANGSLSLGATPSDSTYRFNVNGGTKTDSLIVDNLYAKFGSILATGVPVAPIEFRIASSKTRIDLRPAGGGGWNSNWYGAITHTASETDVLSSPYGSLYLGAANYFGSSGIYLGNTRNNPSMYIRNNNNILVGDTANTGFKFDVNGRARVRDTLTLSTTPVTSDTTANDLLVINSSNGQVRRYTGNWPTPGMPTLQQVTTAGNSIYYDDEYINFYNEDSTNLIGFIRNGGSDLIFKSGIGSTDFTTFRDNVIENYTNNQQHVIDLPDSSGYITQRVLINGTTYDASNKGTVNLGNTDTATVVKAYVTNAEAVTITKGQVVYIFGASGDRASVKLAKNTSDTFSSKTLGIVRADIAAGAAGWITTQGQVSGINLGAYTAGDILWLDSVAGGFTKVKPVAPYHSVFVGVVERANVGNGLIYVKPQNGQELGELHDTKITSPTNNQVLAYTASTDIWENKTFETVGNIKTGSATLDFGNTSAQNSADLTITVTGAASGDVVSLGVPNASVNANTCFTAWVSATDTVTVRFNNYSSGAIDPASGTFKIKVFK